MSTAKPLAGQKRKATSQPQPSSSAARKRQKFQDARTISTQTVDAALSKTGELSIAAFVKSREYEIKALDMSMKKARQGLSARAFQQVPRHLRRRTASHNAKKVPRRLRSRAKQEMIEDNTPIVTSKTHKPTSRLRLRLDTANALKRLNHKRKTVRQKKREAKTSAKESDPSKHIDTVRIPRIKKNKLADPPLATSKFQRRQISKSWLPTHLWHTKRAEMTRPTQPLWRMAIPLTPTEKSYRATHRSSESRGCIAWDTSYTSTIGCWGTDKTLESLLRALHFHGHGWKGQKYEKWKAGGRFANGWICNRDGKEALALVDVFWCATNRNDIGDKSSASQPNEQVKNDAMATHPQKRRTKLDRRIMICIHPSAFYEFWQQLLHIAKVQKPQVLVEDLRFEIGSVEIMGPCAMEILTKALVPQQTTDSVSKVWKMLECLSNPALLPPNILLNFNIQDPRLLAFSKSAVLSKDQDHLDLHELVTDWPLDKEPEASRLFSHKARYSAGNLPSQWALNRRKQQRLLGQTLQLDPKDPCIPVIILAHRSVDQATSQQGRWTLLLPWKCVDVIWRKLLFCTLSSGGKPRFGGLREQQQVAFEQCVPWYPCDFPGTEAGKAWERSQAEERFDRWVRRPPSRRIAWDSLDLGLGRKGELGRGWACDWEFLFENASTKSSNSDLLTTAKARTLRKTRKVGHTPLTQRQRKEARARAETEKGKEAARRNTSSPEADEGDNSDSPVGPPYIQVVPSTASRLLEQTTSILPLNPALVSIKITLLSRGTPKPAARIYRLPLVRSKAVLSPNETTISQVHQAVSTQVNSTPPAGQVLPSSLASQNAGLIHADSDVDLRSRWLSVDAFEARSNVLKEKTKEKRNRWGLPRKQQHHNQESLRHINVLPKNPPASIVEKYGRKPLSEQEKMDAFENEIAVRIEEQKIWDTHVPCPGAEDLIGFVTSGGFNLVEGRGTAVGAVWLQRVLHGWSNDTDAHTDETFLGSIGTKATSNMPHKLSQSERRERHLCVVRNAGESVGRLALWKVCT